MADCAADEPVTLLLTREGCVAAALLLAATVADGEDGDTAIGGVHGTGLWEWTKF